jgi:hypothetical protein
MVADYQGWEYPCRLSPDVRFLGRGDIVPVYRDLANGPKRTVQSHEHDPLLIVPVSQTA